MRTSPITIAVLFAATFVARGQVGSGQPAAGAVGDKPVVRLTVNLNQLTIEKQSGTISFVVDAAASSGFTGTLSGTITVSAPVNPSGVKLTDGLAPKTFPFTVAAGQKTSDTKPPQTGTFKIATSPKNDQSGTLTYTVYIDPSAQFTAPGSPELVKVVAVP